MGLGRGSGGPAFLPEGNAPALQFLEHGLIDFGQDRDLDSGRLDLPLEDELGADGRGQAHGPGHGRVAVGDAEIDQGRDDLVRSPARETALNVCWRTTMSRSPGAYLSLSAMREARTSSGGAVLAGTASERTARATPGGV